MRALRLSRIGERPEVAEIPLPEPGPGELRVRIAAAALNFADLLMVRGEYQVRPELPFTLGMEAAGFVDALGPGTAGPVPGTRVAVVAGTGALAEFGCFPAAACIELPDAVPFEAAAATPVAYGTSYIALSDRAALGPGETLLVLGAAGGVGLTAVEIGRLMGARVIAVARGTPRLEIARAAGADLLIDSDTGDLRAALKAAGGVDVAYDPVGGPAFDAALRALRPGGRILAIGFASGTVPQVPANLLLVKNATVIGFWFGGWMEAFPDRVRDGLGRIFRWQAEGRLRPHVSHVLDLEGAVAGLELLRSRAATGKVVVRTGADG
ncbi:MAG: NADPH:quinone oxidoreductase family protein [Rhodobacteraceae bacterium]|nr:NADPH:quinone oxidoreductase family protein [Paracoccaceae bacterium]